MKATYPVVFSQGESYIVAYVPDLEINTQGKDLTEAIYMARDAIGLIEIAREDEGLDVPAPSSFRSVAHEEDDIVSMVDIDFSEYRRREESRTVKKNCTLPSWLNYRAEQAGVNFSAVLQNALKQELHLA
jgi:predicted RNase H-like HicB family nuclease